MLRIVVSKNSVAFVLSIKTTMQPQNAHLMDKSSYPLCDELLEKFMAAENTFKQPLRMNKVASSGIKMENFVLISCLHQ